MAQIAAMNAGLAGTAAGFAGAGAAGAAFGRQLGGIRPDRFGTRMQYLGRQLQYSFTVPLLAAGVAATHWALENEKALTRVTKVYGDASRGAEFYHKEIKSLEKAFVALSNQFGIHQAEVINIAADWAAAGASGLALAKATELTLKTMVLGEMEAKEATKALIAIQAQYGLSTEQLTEALAVLNMVENQTGASLKDLIDGFSRAAGVARSAGVDVRHLAAMMAALVPATGSAAQAGNALKTIFSRLLSPTNEAKEVMGLMGINIDDMAWKAVNVTDRLMIMAKAFDGLSDSQKGVVASVVASRWQINKFEVLMRELLSTTGFYARALDSTTDKQAIFNQMQKELNAVLNSNPRRLQIIWTMLQNAMADIIQPMIPLILAAASAIQQMVQAFSELNPGLQQFILITLLFLGLAGPLVMYLGSIRILIYELGLLFMFLVRPLGLVVAGFKALAAISLISWFTSVGMGALAATRAVGTFLLRGVVGIVLLRRSLIAVMPIIAMFWKSFVLSAMYAGRVLAIGLPVIWATIVGGAGKMFRNMMVAIRTVMLAGGAAISLAWQALGIGLLVSTKIFTMAIPALWASMLMAMQTVVYAGAAALGGAMRAVQAAVFSMYAATTLMLSGIPALWARMITMVQAVVLAGAAAVGVAWRAFNMGILVITHSAMLAIPALWARMIAAVQAVILAGASAIGIIWRGMIMAITLFTTIGMARLAAVWSRAIIAIQSIILAGATLLGMAWRAVTVTIVVMSQVTMAALPLIWARGLAAVQAVVATFSAAMVFMWRAMHMLMITITVAFTKGLIAVFVKGFTKLIPIIRAGSAALVAAFSGPWGWAILAVVGIFVAFHKQIGQIWNNIVDYFKSNSKALAAAVSPIAGIFIAARNAIIRAFNALPAGVRNALIAVVRIMHAAAMQIYKLMSYLNPFARHSPSLVENVQNGMAIIRDEYASVSSVGRAFADAGADLREFGEAIRIIQRAADAAEWAEIRAEIAKLAPAALASFDRLAAMLNPLKDLLMEIGWELQAQEEVVRPLKAALDAANAAYEEQDNILQTLTDTAQGYQKQLDEAKDRLNDFANAPIEGMKEMGDAIFENQMRQKELQLEMLKMEQAIGPLDKLQSKIDAINGEIELLRGEQNDLRRAGAGSDILGEYDEQISLLQDQQQAIEDQVKPLQDLQDELDKLAQQGQILDLENSLKFDPLKKQIDDLANSMQELPFEEIVAGMQAAQQDIDLYTDKLEEANAAVAQQQAVVDALKATRDALQATYDVENNKLEEIKSRYEEVEERIRAIESAFRDVSSAAEKALGGGGGGGSMSPGAENFLGAAGGDFPEVGGVGGVGREGGLEDQAAMIDEFTKELANKTKNMFGLFNFLEPIKRGWNAAMKWLGDVLGPSFAWIGGLFSNMFDNVKNPFEKVDWGKGMDALETAIKKIGEWLQMVWDLLGPELIRLWENTWPALKGAFSDIGKELVKFKDLIGPMMETTKNLWTVLGPVLGVVLALILLLVKLIVGLIAGVLPPLITAIGEFVAAVIQFFRSIYEFVANIFAGNWSDALRALLEIFIALWDAIFAVLKGAIMIIVGAVVGLVKSIWEWFVWLYDVLVGNSIIPDMMNAIWGWFKKVYDWIAGIMQAIVNFIVARWNDIVNAFNWARGVLSNAVEAVKAVINSITSAIANVWNNIQNYINLIVNAFNNLRNRFSFGGLFDGIISAFRNAINSVIGKWNSMSFGIGDVKIGTPDIPFFARGGVTSGVAIVGEGRQAYPEYVIPTDPNFRGRAIALFLALGKQLGLGSSHSNMLIASVLAGQERGMFGQRVQAFASGGVLGRGGRVRAMGRSGSVVIAPVTKNYNVNFNGNLEFPNVKSGDDAQAFLDNLEALIGD